MKKFESFNQHEEKQEMNYLKKVPREKWDELFNEYKKKFNRIIEAQKTTEEKLKILKEIKIFSDLLLEKYGDAEHKNEKMESYRFKMAYHTMTGSGISIDEVNDFDFYDNETSIRKFIDNLSNKHLKG